MITVLGALLTKVPTKVWLILAGILLVLLLGWTLWHDGHRVGALETKVEYEALLDEMQAKAVQETTWTLMELPPRTLPRSGGTSRPSAPDPQVQRTIDSLQQVASTAEEALVETGSLAAHYGSPYAVTIDSSQYAALIEVQPAYKQVFLTLKLKPHSVKVPQVTTTLTRPEVRPWWRKDEALVGYGLIAGGGIAHLLGEKKAAPVLAGSGGALVVLAWAL